MVVVPAALVHGIMGVSMGWNEITVTPRFHVRGPMRNPT